MYCIGTWGRNLKCLVATGSTWPRESAARRAYRYVKERLLDGRFPGGMLLSENEIAQGLGVSRTPVRQAFVQLEAEELLDLYPRRGALVVPISAVGGRRRSRSTAAAGATLRAPRGRGGAVDRDRVVRGRRCPGERARGRLSGVRDARPHVPPDHRRGGREQAPHPPVRRATRPAPPIDSDDGGEGPDADRALRRRASRDRCCGRARRRGRRCGAHRRPSVRRSRTRPSARALKSLRPPWSAGHTMYDVRSRRLARIAATVGRRRAHVAV